MKRFLRTAILGLMVVGMTAMCFAGPNTGSLSGTVVDAEYGEGIGGALVFIRICAEPDGGLHGNKIYSATTNDFGEFYIADVPVGEWDAIARLRGTGRDEQVVLIEAGAETVVTFELADGGCPGGLQMRLHQGGN